MKTKEKLVPELRFPEFTDEWEEKKLGEISSVSQGLQIPIRKRFKTKSKDRYFYITNEFLKKNSKVKYYIEKPSKSVICNEEDILMTRTGNTGIVVTNVEGAFHNNFFKIKYDKSSVLKDFLVSSLKTYKTQKDIAIKSSGSTIPDLNHSDFYKIKVNIPSIEEQKKLVGFEKKLDEKLELQRKRIEELKTYKKGMMQRIFNQEIRFKDEKGNEYPEWKEKRFSELGTFYNGLKGKNKDSFISGNCRYIQYLNIFDNPLIDNNFNDYGYVKVDKDEEQNEVGYGDILFTQSSETIEEIGMSSVYLDKKHTFLNSFSFGFRFKDDEKIDFKYIAYLLRSNKIRKRIIREGQGSTRFNLSSNRLKKIYIPICSFNEQKKIGSFFYELDKKIELEEEKLKEFEKYKKGLMQRMFI